MTAQVPGKSVGEHPQVFVSYAHDNDEHRCQVLLLARFLITRGIKVEIDSWHTGKRMDWLAWATKEISQADFIIVVASAQYRLVGDGDVRGDHHRSVQYEASVLRELLHRDRLTWLPKMLPTLLPGHTLDELPLFLQPYGASHFKIDAISDAGLEQLLRVLTSQPLDIAPELGASPVLSPRKYGYNLIPRTVSFSEPMWHEGIHWRRDLVDLYQEPPCATVELHLAPASATVRMPAWRMAPLAEELADLGHDRLLFSAEDVRVISSDQIACAHAMSQQSGWSGLAVHQDGQRSGWIPLPHNISGSILDREDLTHHLTLLMTMLLEVNAGAPLAVAPALRLQPIGRLREGHVSELASPAPPFPSSWAAQVSVEARQSTTYEEVTASPHEIVRELVIRLLTALHK